MRQAYKIGQTKCINDFMILPAFEFPDALRIKILYSTPHKCL